MDLDNYSSELVNTEPCSFEAHGNIERLNEKNKAGDIAFCNIPGSGSPYLLTVGVHDQEGCQVTSRTMSDDSVTGIVVKPPN